MRYGFILHQRDPEIMGDVGSIRALVESADSNGYDHVRTAEHVLGANSASRPDWSGSYDHTQLWHDPFVLFAYIAALIGRMELATSILVLPQRQAPLVAKQAAEVDILTEGRLRLGIGVGWNAVEFEALGKDFTDRGERCEEQIEVMRELWTNELVTFEGKWHKIVDSGINPKPIQQPIPVWIGGGPGSTGTVSSLLSERVLRRVARLADGWFPSVGLDSGINEAIPRLRSYAIEYGRDPLTIGVEGSISIYEGTPDTWRNEVMSWYKIGATHLSVITGGTPGTPVDEHIQQMRLFKESVQDLLSTK